MQKEQKMSWLERALNELCGIADDMRLSDGGGK